MVRLIKSVVTNFAMVGSLASIVMKLISIILYLFIHNLYTGFPRPYIHPRTMPDPSGFIDRTYWRFTSRSTLAGLHFI